MQKPLKTHVGYTRVKTTVPVVSLKQITSANVQATLLERTARLTKVKSIFRAFYISEIDLESPFAVLIAGDS